MQLDLYKHGYLKITLGREAKPHHLVERNKFLNCLDEAFGSIDLLFHLEGLGTRIEAWEKLEDLFCNQYDL